MNVKNSLNNNISQYKKVDIIVTIIVLIWTFSSLYLFGKYYTFFPTITLFGYKMKVFAPFELVIIFAILLVRKQPLLTIGLTLKRWKKSFILGLSIGLVFLVIALFSAQINNLYFKGIPYLMFKLIYYTFEIAFAEEVIFRGFLQTSLVKITQSKSLSFIVTGLLFSLSHIPFQIHTTDYNIIMFIQYNYVMLLITFLYHFLFTFLYYKYNNIIAPVIVHLFIDLSFSLFSTM